MADYLSLSATELRDMARRYRQTAARYRNVVAQETQRVDTAVYLNWPEMKSTLLRAAESYDRDAMAALKRAEELEASGR